MKNQALAKLQPFIGEWEYTLSNCWFLETLEAEVRGFTTVERLKDSLIVVRNTSADKRPGDVWVIGYSDPQQKYEMLYCDERGVSRIFNITFDGKKMICSREDTDMYQRMTLEVTTTGLQSVAEASDDKGKTWRKDFDITYSKK